ncbi:MAG: class I SAM-dependent methyltransferase [Candidatus Krumholzibacteria bacterium]|nr:class I SAM-dependent methyltransferase [Candidatus Krumholzibacteria bacterium]
MDLRDVYSLIPRRYETVNHLITLGLDPLWRRAAVRAAVGEAGPGPWLDLCSGTGETAALLSKGAPDGATVAAADFSLPMLLEGRRRRPAALARAVAAEAASLPFRDGTFGLVAVTFAARNLDSRPGLLEASLAEICRVLRPGGVLVNLETSRPAAAPARWALDLWAGRAVPLIGRLLTGERAGYVYLSSSIRRFRGADELAAAMLRAGFSGVGRRPLLFGAAAIHTAVR